MFHTIGTFFMEKKGGTWAMSLGRTAFIILFALAFYMWSPFLGAGVISLPSDMLTLLMTLAAYNLGSKGVTIVSKYIEAIPNKLQKGDKLKDNDELE